MASSLNSIKKRINLTKNIEKITNALKHTSSTKMKRFLKDFDQYKDYLSAIYNSLDLLNISLKLPKDKKTFIYVVSSEIGLCGSYNSKVYSALLDEMKKVNDVEIILIGNKLKRKLSKFKVRELEIPTSSINSPKLVRILNDEAMMLTSFLNEKQLSKIIVIGHKFINQLVQTIEVFKIFPFDLSTSQFPKSLINSIEFVPSKEKLFNSIVPFYLSAVLKSSIFESLLCIEAMRNLAMDKATKNAREFIDDLTLEHNRARQALITQEIIEIVSGALGG